tara:strand:- start:28 stop:138 length:111 start_codon:yes stop_codon:yes gene_type:complete
MLLRQDHPFEEDEGEEEDEGKVSHLELSLVELLELD